MKKIFFVLIVFFSLIVFSKLNTPVLATDDPFCQINYCMSGNHCSEEVCSGENCDYLCNRIPYPDDRETTAGKITNPFLSNELSETTGKGFFQRLLRTGISFTFVIGAVIFLFMLIWGAIRWLSSSGDKAKLETAQKQISSALIGLVILLSVFAIIKLLEQLFGISLLRLTLPTMSN